MKKLLIVFAVLVLSACKTTYSPHVVKENTIRNDFAEVTIQITNKTNESIRVAAAVKEIVEDGKTRFHTQGWFTIKPGDFAAADFDRIRTTRPVALAYAKSLSGDIKFGGGTFDSTAFCVPLDKNEWRNFIYEGPYIQCPRNQPTKMGKVYYGKEFDSVYWDSGFGYLTITDSE